MISVHCPLPLLQPDTPPVLITRQCTDGGWSELSVPYYTACYYEGEEEEEDGDMGKEKNYLMPELIYSVGYGASLAALFIAVLLFCCFRRLLCTRNYIHLHLCAGFMLRSLAVFVKDVVLFADKSTDHCTVSTVNLGIFLNISRIIVQKTKATHVNQSDTLLYRTLLHSTLLLIPLFGVHYVVFALIPEDLGVGPRLYFELVLGSFQGFIVALLYCYLNGEVQKEIQRTLRRWWPKTETNAINLPTQEYVP
ncbi:hypothetical protein KUCAC02_027068 [Chaenocephalus aceratus]|uniref:Uncharacterized protein n=1 Tax=Chaenocephalus aceratus TaxID=36190 RepID=A0ACB9W384_CHAAC|nr:hypothetical protein KUCAC02_027068 [Chaenocephalus aceratus]